MILREPTEVYILDSMDINDEESCYIIDVSELLYRILKEFERANLGSISLSLAEDDYFLRDMLSLIFTAAVNSYNTEDDEIFQLMYNDLTYILPTYGFGRLTTGSTTGETIVTEVDDLIFPIIDIIDPMIQEVIGLIYDLNFLKGEKIRVFKYNIISRNPNSPYMNFFITIADHYRL